MGAAKFVMRRIAVSPETEVSSVWAIPQGWEAGPKTALILAHGAGNDMHSTFLSRVHESLAQRGILTIKFNFPYKERGGRAPDRTPVLEATWRAVAQAVRADELAPCAVFFGGKSMGGRIASHLAATGEPCAGLVFLGYPLHPARQPDKLRAGHLARITCPMLFMEGTRDPLCDLELLEQSLASVKAPVTLHLIEGGDHSFKLPKAMGRTEAEVWDEIVEELDRWIAAIISNQKH